MLCDDLRAVDVDVDDAALVAGVRALAETVLGAGALVRHRDGSPRVLMLYRAAVPGQRKRAVKSPATGYKVEVLGRGQQCVAYGRHPSGALLRWEGERSPDAVSLADLPAVDEAAVTVFLQGVCALLGIEQGQAALPDLDPPPANAATLPRDGQDVPVTMEDVRAALAVIPDDGGDYDLWLRVGAMVHAVDRGHEGLDAYMGWSSRSPKFDRAGVMAQWRELAASPLRRVGVGSLIHMAREADSHFLTPSLRTRLGRQAERDTDWYRRAWARRMERLRRP